MILFQGTTTHRWKDGESTIDLTFASEDMASHNPLGVDEEFHLLSMDADDVSNLSDDGLDSARQVLQSRPEIYHHFVG